MRTFRQRASRLFSRARPRRRVTSFFTEPLESRLLLAAFEGIPAWRSAWMPYFNNTNTTIPAQNHPTSGGVHAVAPHPNDRNVLYVATVNGGIWRTRNAQDISVVGYRPSWTPLTDRYPSSSFGDIVFDLSDPNRLTLWASIARLTNGTGPSGPAGGLLRTTDGGDTWVPMAQGTLGNRDVVKVVPTLVNDPTTGQQIVMAATLSGLLRSVDGGNTFNPLAGAAGAGFAGLISDLVADPGNNNVFYASVPTRGVYRSTDAGVTWGLINNGMTGVGGVPSGGRIRLAATRGALYAAIVHAGNSKLVGVYRLANPDQAASTNWASMGVPETPAGPNGPVVGAGNASPIVITANNHGQVTGDRVRIAGVNGNTAANGDWQITRVDANNFSLDTSTGNGAYSGGGTWQALFGVHPRNRPGGQGNINLSLVADPNNPNLVFIGGDRSNNRNAGNLFRGAFGANPVWAPIVDAGANGTAPHADSRDMEFDAGGDLIQSDDGGVTRLDNVGQPGQVWQSLVGTLDVHEVYSVRKAIDGPYFGTQDTGTPGPNRRTEGSTFPTHYDDWSGGDGGIVAWDSTSIPDRDVLYVSSQRLNDGTSRFFKRELFDAAGNHKETQTVQLVVTGAGGSNLTKTPPGNPTPRQFVFDNTIRFIQPYILNAVNPMRMLIGTSFLYESTDRGDNLTSLGGLNNLNTNGNDDDADGAADEGDEFTAAGGLGGLITAMAYGGGTGANANANVIYAAAGANLFLRQGATGLPTAVAAPAGVGTIKDIVLDPDDWKIAHLIDSAGRVFQTNDATATPTVWTNVSGDIARIVGSSNGAAFELQTIDIAKIDGTRVLFAGGSGGVFFTTDANGARWREFGNFLPNVVVRDLDYDERTSSLYAGTYGRGVWSVFNVPQFFADGKKPTTLTVNGDNDAAGENNIITLAADPNVPNLLRLTVAGGTEDKRYTIEVGNLDRIRIVGGAGFDIYNIEAVGNTAPVTIDRGTASAIVHIGAGGGRVQNIQDTITLAGDPNVGSTRLIVDGRGDPNPAAVFNNIRVSTVANDGRIENLIPTVPASGFGPALPIPVTWNAAARVNEVAIYSTATSRTFDVVATGVPTLIVGAAPAAGRDVLNVGTANRLDTIQAPLTYRAENSRLTDILLLNQADFLPRAVTVDQHVPPGDNVPYGRIRGLAPADISFKFASIRETRAVTAWNDAAISVFGAGSATGRRSVSVNEQPLVTVLNMDLDGGLAAADATNLTLRGNTIAETTAIVRVATVLIDANPSVANLVVTSSSGVTATGNTVTGNVTVGAPASPYEPSVVTLFQGNTVRGTMTVHRRSRVTMRSNTVARLVAARGTVAAANGPSVAGVADAATIDAQGNRFGVVELLAPAVGTVTGNDIGWRDAGATTPHAVALRLEATFGGAIQDNEVHNAVVGVLYLAASPLVGNRIFGNTTGVVMPVNDITAGLGFAPGSGRNDVYGNTTGVNLTGRMRNQLVRSNVTGVIGSGILGGDAFDLANLIDSNTVGADFDGTIQFNRFTRNGVGILANDRQVVVHNLVYRNTGAGVRTEGADDVRIVHNTFFNTAGNAVQVDGGSQRAEILNNVFQADAGFAINVAADGQQGFFSDFNDLYSTGAGQIVRYGTREYDDIVDLQQDLYLFDLYSIGTSRASPGFPAPRFVDPSADDFRVVAVTGGQRASSPTVDSGSAAIDFPAVRGARNLLANPSFENGTGSWAVNVGGSTRSAGPAPVAFGGTQYFAPGAVAAGFAEQTVSLLAAGFTAGQLDSNGLVAVFGGRLRSAGGEFPADDGRLTLAFLDGAGVAIGSGLVLPSNNVDDRWELVGGRFRVPAGTRSVRYRFDATRLAGTTNDAYLDNAFLDLRPSTAAPDMGAYGATVGDLELAAAHLHMVFPDLYTDWERGTPHLIEWQTFGNDTNSPVKIDLYQDLAGGGAAQFLKTLFASTPDTGRVAWIPEADLIAYGTRGLRVQVSLVSNPSVSDRSSEAFAVPEQNRNLYVNDASTTGDEYSTAPGDYRNTGRSPSSPKPSLTALLRGYALGAGDIVYVDTGVYVHDASVSISSNPAAGGDQGVTILGPANAARVARITAPADEPVFDVNAGNFVTISNLTLAGGSYGVWVRNGSSRFTGSRLTTIGAVLDGVRLEANVTDSTLDFITASDSGRDGISVGGPGIRLSNSVAHHNFNAGILYANAGAAALTRNESYNNKYGLLVTNSVFGTTTLVGDPNLALAPGNRFHDNSVNGVVATGGVQVAGNTVFNTAGNGVGGAGIGVYLIAGATGVANVAHGNFIGVYSDRGAVINNRTFNNADSGILAAADVLVQGNVVYSNGVGIQSRVPFGGPTLLNNLVYANATRGIWLRGGGNTRVENNTVYQPAGDAVRVDPGSSAATGVRVRNNVLFAGTGSALFVDPSSEAGFQSDYNLFSTSGAGRVGTWEGVASATLNEWRTASLSDTNSIFASPGFVDFDGADNALGYAGGVDRGGDDDFHEQSTAGSFHGGSLAPAVGAGGLPVFPAAVETADAAVSPAVDRGDPTSAFANEPVPSGAFINLGAYGNTAQASKSPAAYVRVLVPDGGENILAGRTFDVLWRSHDTAGTVNVDLLRGSSPQTAIVVQPIAAGAPNSGRYVWSVPAGLTPGGGYYVRVTRPGPPAVADLSDVAFTVSAGALVFYVNDGSFAAGDWATAPGNDANDGLSPAAPKRSVQSVLSSYDLGPGDVIRVDSGAYALANNITITANDAGVKVEGYHDAARPAARAVFTRGAAAGAVVFDLQNADGVTLDYLTLAGGGAAVGINAGNGADSDGVTVSHSDVSGFGDYGILVGGTNDNWTLSFNRVHDNSAGFYRTGVYFNTVGGPTTNVTVLDNVVYNNSRNGIALENVGGNSLVGGNDVYANGTGISVSSAQGGTVAVRANTAHDNVSVGIFASGPGASVTGNTARGHSASTGFGYGINVQGGAGASGNVAFANAVGIVSVGGGDVSNNRAYGNTRVGISSGGSNAVGNVVYNNPVGLEGDTSPLWANNLAYDNPVRGMHLRGGGRPQILNNTVYQVTGDALTVESTRNNLHFQNIRVRNNVLWAQGGYAIVLGPDTAPGLQSDYNDLYATGTGRVGLWENVARATLTAWQQATLVDANSMSVDPRFVDAAGGDFHEQSTQGSFHGGSLAPVLNPATGLPAAAGGAFANDPADSPAIDSGAPTDPAANEPAPNGDFVNLGTYGGTAQASRSRARYFRVDKPNGGESWSTRQTFPILWRGDRPGVGAVDIDLMHRGPGGGLALESSIAAGAANNGRFDWVVPQTIPAAGDYVVRITRVGAGDVVPMFDVSDGTFAIAAGSGIYYVNDSAVNPGDWTTAPGDDSNSGLDPARPKATIAGVLSAYALGAGDVIRVDAGNYALNGNIVITPADSGVTVRGYSDAAYPDRRSVLDRGTRAGNAFVFELAGADDVTIDRVAMTNAYYGIAGPFNADADRVTIANSEIYNMAWAGMYVGGANDDWAVTGNRFHDNYINLWTEGAGKARITGNLVYAATFGGGIRVSNGRGSVVTGNEVYGNSGDGISADGATVSENVVRDNRGTGINVGAGTVATGNTVYGHNANFQIGIFNQSGEVRGNTVYGNYDGIVTITAGLVDSNRVFNNRNAGIALTGGTARRNVVYSNAVGVAAQFSALVAGNLVYGNFAAGITVGTAGNAVVEGNTVYQPAGDALRVSLDTNNTRLSTTRVRNNILWAGGAGGYAVNVTNDSEVGFLSDFNDLYAGGGAKVAKWHTQEFASLREWAWEMGIDVHSTSADPQFVDVDGADGVMGYRPASAGTPGDFGADDNFRVASESPTVDAADPASTAFAEPSPNGGRANLGHTGNTPLATTSAAGQALQVLSPNGGEKVQAGRPLTVEWRSSGLTQNRVVALLDAGGPGVASPSGEWGPADGFATTRLNLITSGVTDLSGVPNPAPADVYRTLSYADIGLGNVMGYRLPVSDGAYTIRLHWIEGFVGAGQRKFDVRLQGAVVQSDYDVYAAAGGFYRATALSFPVTAAGGNGILIDLVNKTAANPAFLCGIEITAANAGGVANPTADVQLSLDGGANWATVGTGAAMDALGRGSFTFIPSGSSDNAMVRVVSRDGTLPRDISDAPFQLAPGGRDFYVNDGSTAGDLVTTAVGANANHGKSPSRPMASIAAVLAVYDLAPGDVIHVDAGEYVTVHNTLLRPQDSGVTIRGAGASSSTPVARINRSSSTPSAVVFDFRDGDDVTIDHLAITGGLTGVNSYYNVDSDRVTLVNNDIFGNRDYGVFVATGGDDWVVANNRVHDNAGSNVSTGVSFNGNFANAVIRDNVVFNHLRYGIYVAGNFAGATVSGNEAYGNGTGIWSSIGTVSNNRVHHNTTGIYAERGVTLVAGNTAWTNGEGVVASFNEGLPPMVVENNRVFDNSVVGIGGGGNAVVRNNFAYTNRVGIVAPRGITWGGGQVYNNVVYANTLHGILVENANGTRLSNNTVYQLVGDAVRVQNASNVWAHGNVLWVAAGADLYVAANAQAGFKSDFNLLYHGAGAQGAAGFWGGGARASLADWRAASGQDAGSAEGDPRFVDVDGADNVLGWTPAGPGGIGYDGGGDDDFYLAAGSPAIDRGHTWFGPTTDVEGFARADDPATANVGGPEYVPAAGANQFAGGGTRAARFNNSYFTFNLPFDFPFYGTTFPTTSRVYVSTEGYLHFEGPDLPSGAANTVAEFVRNRRIAPLWDNINVGTFVNAAEGVYTDATVAGQVKFTWVGVNEAGGTPVNFSVVLFADGRVRFDYGAGNAGLTPTVGLSMGDGQHYVLISGYDGAAGLGDAGSVGFTFVPGIVDAGAYEFRGSSGDVTPATVTGVTPGAIGTGGAVPQGTRQIDLVFSEALNSIDAKAAANFRLVGAGVDGTFDTADDVAVAVVPRYSAAFRRVSLELVDPFPAGGVYRLTVLGGAQTGVHDLSGLRLDGDGDGVAGGDYVRTFTVTADGVAPTVAGVWIAGSDWSAAFRNFLQTSALGSAEFGFALGGGVDQLKSLPWTNLNQVTVRFSEHVLVAADDLALAGVNAAGYGVIGFNYNAVTFTATWTLAANLPTDKLLLRLASGPGGVTDAAGNRLDGEWQTSGNLPSGNGATGGDFLYRLNVVPGDANRDGRVSAVDLLQTRSRVPTSITNPGRGTARYSVFHDVDGDGRIGSSDLVALRRNALQALPGGEPLAPVAASSLFVSSRRGSPTVRGLLDATIKLP